MNKMKNRNYNGELVLGSSFFVTLMAKKLSDCYRKLIGTVNFCQWRFAPLCGCAFDKNCHP